MATRRIKPHLKDFLLAQTLDFKEKRFIEGCLRCQHKYPQLSSKQWEVIVAIERKYKGKVPL